MKKIKIKQIGGCNLGERPINYHLDALKEFNVKIKEKNEIDRINFVISCANEITSMTKKALLSNLMSIRDSSVSQ